MGLVGGNGAGKSTLMKALSGARPPDSGQILVDGSRSPSTTRATPRRYGIETIYQTLALADNLDCGCQHVPGPRARDPRRHRSTTPPWSPPRAT